MQTSSCDSAAPPLWGVLVANTAPTFESGLLTFAQARYRAFRSAVVHENGALSKDVFATPGDAWLWTCLPAPQRSKHFPLSPPHVEKSNDKSSTGGGPAAAGASSPSNGGKPDGVAALEEEEAAYTSLRLLLPLCSARHAGQVTIGRLDSNDIALEGNPCISSVHCAVSFQPRSTREAASWGDSAASQQATQDAVVRAIAQHHGNPMHTPSPSDHRAKVTDRTDPCSSNSCDVPLKTTQERAGATQRGDGAPSQTAGPCTTANTNTAPARIVLSDYSRNGCLVNGRQVGQGKSANLHSGDTVELVYGGHNHRTDYNLAFTFYTVDGFLEWLSRQQQQQQQQHTGSFAKEEGSEGLVHTEFAAAAAAKKKRSDDQRVKQQSLRRQREIAARRHALLSRAQWNVEAQVRRMYAHRVDEFYALDHANPLGKGSFGVVYRAALRTDAPPHASGRHHAPSLSAVTARILAQAGLAAGKEASGKGVSRGNSSDTPMQQQQQQLQLFSPAAACIWTTNPALEAQLAEAYTCEKEQRPPAAVLQAASAAATAVTPGSPSVSLPVLAAASPTPYVFAVKVIRKQRMLLDVLQQQQHEDTESAISNNNNNNNNNGNAIPTTSISALTAAEVAVIQQLAQLETQPADLAEQRQEEWIAGALASLQLSDAAGALGSCGGFAQGSMGRAMEHFSQALTASTQEGANAQEWLMSHPVAPASSSSTPLSSSSCPSPSSSAAQQRREQRLQRRRQLLSYLPVPLRRAYERELNHRRRQQCEINILLAVRHPCVTSLFEVFDQPDQLALVMEQATGGELFDLLLSRYKRRRRQRRGVKQAREEAEKEVVMSRRGVAAPAAASMQQHAPAPAHHQEQQQPTEGEEGDANGEAFAAEDIDLIGSGGPLPEYLVKIIIVQVLEAVLYLHTMGIIHRDLKLENLMLHRPCDRYALNALQLQMFLQQLREYERATRQQQQHRPSNNAHVFSERGEAAFSSRMMEEVEFSNPLSALYTVHIPRALWPVVKVTDFGLSRVLDQLQTRPSSSSSSSTTTVETLHGFTAASRTSEAAGGSREVPERVKLIYARNDATTSCGTPIYAAPEICDPSLRPNRVGYGAAVDMYSVGVIAYALLTGRSPFSTRQDPRRPDKRPVVDYDGPLRFDRHRQAPPAAKQSEGKDNNKVDTAPVQQQQQQAARRHTITSTIAEEPAVFLPSLAVLESIRVPFPPPAVTPSDGTAADQRVNEKQFEERGGEGGKKKGGKAPEATAHTERWRQHVDAFAERFRRVEDESLLQQCADQCASTSSTRPSNSLFHTVVHKLIQSLKNYADGCALHDEEVDLDRLVYVSLLANAASGRTARADGGGLSSSSSSPPLTDVGRLLDENGHVGRVSLPPVSALAASFLRGLLEKYPLQRLTAYEALQHPWLRECVAAEPAQSPD